MAVKIGEWMRENVAVFVASLAVLTSATLAIAERAATESVAKHNNADAVHAELTNRVNSNATDIKVLTKEMQVNQRQLDTNLGRLERALDRFEQRLDDENK